MRALFWLAVTLFSYATAVVVIDWPALKELWHAKSWQITRTDEPKAELAGVRISIAEQYAIIAPTAPDRAVVYLRLALDGAPEQRAAWLFCDIALSDDQGQRWLPLMNELGGQLLALMGDKSGRSCSQSLNQSEENGGPVTSEQVFMLPADRLSALRLELSGAKTRPKAVSMPLRPVLRQSPP